MAESERHLKSAITGALKALASFKHPAPLVERFLQKGNPSDPFSKETRTLTDPGGVVHTETRYQTRADFVEQVIKPLEVKHKMSTDEMLRRYDAVELDLDGRDAGEFVYWAGLTHIMQRDIPISRKPLTVPSREDLRLRLAWSKK